MELAAPVPPSPSCDTDFSCCLPTVPPTTSPSRVYFRDNPAAVGNIRRGPARRCPRVGVAVERVRVEHRPLMRRAREGHSLCHCTPTRRAASLCRTGALGSDTRSRGRCFHRPPGIPTRQRVAQVGRRHARGQHGNGQSRQNVTKGTNTKANTAAIRASFHGAARYRIPQAPRARHSTQVGEGPSSPRRARPPAGRAGQVSGRRP